MTKTDWIKKHKAHTGKVMYEADFKRFFKDTNMTLEAFAIACGYSIDGVISMLKRGTIKPSTCYLVLAGYPQFENYIINWKGGKHNGAK